MSTASSLEVEGLCKTYGEGADAVEAVRGAAFSARPGEFLAVVGPSGSGKTTLLAMIGGLLSPSAGTIRAGGTDVARLSPAGRARYRRETVGYVFQANNLLPFLTAIENLMVVNAIGRGSRAAALDRATRLLTELGVAHRAKALASTLSGGERQRVAIARAMMNDPAIILVDEPTANLDSQRGRQVVGSLMTEIRSRRKLGIMVTHDSAMAALAGRVLEMHDGVLREA